MVLEARKIEAKYDTGQVLHGMDFEIERGEVVSILGRNGAGKTTTLRSVMGVTPPELSGGTVTFDGEDVTGMEPYKRVREGLVLVPQGGRIWPGLTVEENIRMTMKNTSEPKGMDEILNNFPALQEMRQKQGRNLSGGEQQMVAIARALASNPEVIMMDEPSEGLAPFIIRDVENVIQRLHEEENMTILLVEQNVVMAMEVSDRHYLIDQGQMVAETTPKELGDDEDLRQEYLGV